MIRHPVRPVALLSILGAAVAIAGAACESRVSLDGDIAGPGELSATALRSRIQLTWSGVEGADYYEVFQGNAAGTSPEIYNRVLTSTVPELSVQQVIPGTTYHFVVTAVIGGERSAPTGEVATAALEDSPVSTTPAWSAQGFTGTETRFGAAIGSARDVNHDGRGDLMIASPAFGAFGKPPLGKVEVFLGDATDAVESDAVFSIIGKQTGGGFGVTLVGVPDVNEDGFDDVLVAEPFGFLESSGRVFAYYGTDEGALGIAPTVCQPNGTTECAFLFAPEYKATIGHSVGVFDDQTGDGRPDLWVGAPFLASSTSGGMVELYAVSEYGTPTYPAVFTYISPDGGDGLGMAVASGRDVDGDGIPDAIAGAPLATNDRGRVVLFVGSSGSLSGPAWSADGVADGDRLGTHVTLADVNCDSLADVIVGVPGADVGGASDAGAVAVFHGGALPLSSTPDEELFGQVPGESFGVLAAVGDVDGDGCDDLLVGSPSFDGVFDDEGRAQIFRGGAEGLATDPVWTDFGRFPLARFGEAVTGAGDVDGDSFLDIAVGAPDFDFRGQVTLYRGLAPSGPQVSAGLPERVGVDSPFQPQLAGFSDPTQGQELTCVWSWDDGEDDTIVTPCTPLEAGGVTHVFRAEGVYRVRLRVVRSDGVVGEAVTLVTVE